MPPFRHHPLTRLDVALAALILGLALVLYGRTLAPGLLLGDSAEFQTLAYTLGMSHATGYPVYLLLARLFTYLPLGDLAYRVNLFTAVFASLALSLLYLNGRLLAGWRLAALLGVLAMGLCQLFWWQAVIAELYVIAAAWMASILLLIFRWRQTGNAGYLAGAGLLGGLSLGIHNTVALLVPGILLYLLLTARLGKAWLAAAMGAVAGVVLALAAFLLIDALDSPSTYYNSTLRHGVSAWGMTADDVNSPLERLKFLFGARQFQMWMFTDPANDVPLNVQLYWAKLTDNFAPVFLGLALLGGIAALVWRWREGVLLWVSWLGMLLFLLNYNIGDIQVFYIPSYVLLALAAVLGAATLLDGLQWLSERSQLPVRWQRAVVAGGGLILLTAVLQPKLRLISDSWAAGHITFLDGSEWERYYPYPVADPESPHNFATYVVNNLEDDAILFSTWDKLYPYYFVAHVEQGRLGMAFHEEYVQDGLIGTADSTRAYITANLGQRPIYFDHRPPDDIFEQYLVLPAREVPFGYKIHPREVDP